MILVDLDALLQSAMVGVAAFYATMRFGMWLLR